MRKPRRARKVLTVAQARELLAIVRDPVAHYRTTAARSITRPETESEERRFAHYYALGWLKASLERALGDAGADPDA